MSDSDPSLDYRFLKLLHDIDQCLYASEDPQKVLDEVILLSTRFFKVSHGTISLFNPNSNRLEIEAFVGFPKECQEWQLPMGMGLTGWVALHNKGACVNDTTQDPRYVCMIENLNSAIAIPLVIDSSALGVVSLESPVKGAFSELHLEQLTEITRTLGRVLDKVWRINNLNRKNVQLDSVVKMVGKVSNRFELESLLVDVTSEARRIIHCEMCSLFLLNSEGALQLEVLVGKDGPMEHSETVELGETTMGTAVLHQKSVEVSNLAATEEHLFIGLDERHRLVGMLSTPLVYEEKVIGVLNAYTSEPHRFSNTEKQVFGALADIGAFAIENTKLYTRIIDSEDMLRQSERLTTLGTLASEIAHEIRNPLTVIRLLVESIGFDMDEEDPKQRDFKVVLDNIDNLGEIVGRVLNFGKSQSQMFARWNTHVIVEECIQLVRFKLKRSKIKVEFLESDDVVVNCNKGQIQQVFLNLFINAEEAMPEGGEIHIRSKLSEDAEKVFFEFTDNGGGIPDAIRESVFESFLTGKSKGTGLGLAIVKRILRDHRGDIEITQSSDIGTTFIFWLPLNH